MLFIFQFFFMVSKVYRSGTKIPYEKAKIHDLFNVKAWFFLLNFECVKEYKKAEKGCFWESIATVHTVFCLLAALNAKNWFLFTR